jgi:hypothetical protein
MGVGFLDFLRSGAMDIHAFAESRRGRRPRPPTREPKALPADASAEELAALRRVSFDGTSGVVCGGHLSAGAVPASPFLPQRACGKYAAGFFQIPVERLR